MGIARNWLESCRTNYQECKIATIDSLSARLIELRTEERNHVYLHDTTGLVSVDYAASSYCWDTGKKGIETTTAKLHEFQGEGLVIEDPLPTVGDAVRVTETLGLRYLWIDRLCTVQDDEEDWARGSSQMCNIYQGDVLTISADESTSV
jgi:Heterokaryon incompatibility protein (HET)